MNKSSGNRSQQPRDEMGRFESKNESRSSNGATPKSTNKNGGHKSSSKMKADKQSW